MTKLIYKTRIEDDPVGLTPVFSDLSVPERCGMCALGPYVGENEGCSKAPCTSNKRPDNDGVYYIINQPNPRKTDIKRLNALVKRWKEQEETLQRLHGDAWPLTHRASTKLDCAALARILKLLEQFQGA